MWPAAVLNSSTKARHREEKPTLVGLLSGGWKCFGVRPCKPLVMLLLDGDELPELPDELEMDLVERLGSGGLATIDANLLACTEEAASGQNAALDLKQADVGETRT